MVGKSSRLRLVAEGKSKRNNREEIAQRGSLNSLLKGVETMSDEAGKKAGKETNGVEDPLTNHRAKATGLQKVRDSSVKDHGNHEMHFMECSWPLERIEKRNSWMVPVRMGSYSHLYTSNHVRKM